MGLKCDHTCRYKRGAEGALMKEGSNVSTEAGCNAPEHRDAILETGKGKETDSPEPLEGASRCHHHDFSPGRLWTSGLPAIKEELCSVLSRHAGVIVTAATRTWYTCTEYFIVLGSLLEPQLWGPRAFADLFNPLGSLGRFQVIIVPRSC